MQGKGKEITGILSSRRGSSIASFLRRKFGGDWRYDGKDRWFCSDGVREVRRVRSELSCGKENRWYGARYFLCRTMTGEGVGGREEGS